MNNTKYIEFPNIGYLEIFLSDEELDPILQEIAEIKNDFSNGVKHNEQLVGNLSKEYRLFKSKNALNEIVFRYLREYNNKTHYTDDIRVLTSNVPMIIDEPWVNFQSKYEFNPPHKHNGIISFVIWIQIPYDIRDEMNVVNSKNSATPLAGHFSFHYSNILGEVFHHHIPADKAWENKMIIFPASLNHSVNPFYTSDDYRISVSGNIKFLT